MSENNPFTPLFQRELMAILLQLPDVYTQYAEIWQPTYFDDPNHRKISAAYIRIRESGNEHPTEVSIRQELLKQYDYNDLPIDVEEMLKEVEVLYTIPPQNINYSVQEVKKWAQHHALMQAMGVAIDLIDDGKSENILPLFQKAMMVGDGARLAGPDFYRTEPILPAEIIPGLLYCKSIGVLSGESKSYKTWNLIAMCIAVGLGKSWLGFGPCKPRRTLYCNLELEGELFKDRVDKVARAMGTTRSDLEGHVDFLNLKGKPNQIDRLLPRIRASHRIDDPWGLVIIEPMYKLYGTGDGKEVENSTGAISAMFEKLEQFANDLETSMFLAHHFKKGQKGSIRDIDLASGSGVFARAPDCMLYLKELKTEDTWSCIPILQYFSRIKPFGLRLGTGDQWPLLIRDDSVDLTEEAGKPGAPTKYSLEAVVALLPSNGLTSKAWMDRTIADLRCSKSIFYDRKKAAIESGFVKYDGDPSKVDTVFVQTDEGQAANLRAKVAAASARQNGNKQQFKNSKR
jgi:hypothetical protein